MRRRLQNTLFLRHFHLLTFYFTLFRVHHILNFENGGLIERFGKYRAIWLAKQNGCIAMGNIEWPKKGGNIAMIMIWFLHVPFLRLLVLRALVDRASRANGKRQTVCPIKKNRIGTNNMTRIYFFISSSSASALWVDQGRWCWRCWKSVWSSLYFGRRRRRLLRGYTQYKKRWPRKKAECGWNKNDNDDDDDDTCFVAPPPCTPDVCDRSQCASRRSCRKGGCVCAWMKGDAGAGERTNEREFHVSSSMCFGYLWGGAVSEEFFL